MPRAQKRRWHRPGASPSAEVRTNRPRPSGRSRRVAVGYVEEVLGASVYKAVNRPGWPGWRRGVHARCYAAAFAPRSRFLAALRAASSLTSFLLNFKQEPDRVGGRAVWSSRRSCRARTCDITRRGRRAERCSTTTASRPAVSLHLVPAVPTEAAGRDGDVEPL